jgi:hypothetical protein
MYSLACGQTKYIFAEEQASRMQKYYTSLFAVAGEEFAAHLKAREPMALFVIMYWAVLVDRAARREWGAWILGETGRQLVGEVSEMLLVSSIADIPGVSEGIAWTRYQVGLTPLPGCSLPSGLSGVLPEDCDEKERRFFLGTTEFSQG